MINSPYINSYGLLNAKLEDINAENAPLWSMEYLLMKHDAELFDSLISFIHSCKTEEDGLYHQFPERHGSKDDYMSPDQLIAFVAALKKANLQKQVDNIWKYLKRHLGTYDNLQPGVINKERMMQISALAFSAAAAGNICAKFVLSLACIYSCMTKKDHTSGKLKAWVMFKTLNMKITEKICTFFIGKTPFKDWKGIFFEYFKEEEHPIRKLF